MSWNTILIVLDVLYVIVLLVYIFVFYDLDDGEASIYIAVIGVILFGISILTFFPGFMLWFEDTTSSIGIFAKENCGKISVFLIADVFLIVLFKNVVSPNIDYCGDTALYIFGFFYIVFYIIAVIAVVALLCGGIEALEPSNLA